MEHLKGLFLLKKTNENHSEQIKRLFERFHLSNHLFFLLKTRFVVVVVVVVVDIRLRRKNE